jgi:hypothetical protein
MNRHDTLMEQEEEELSKKPYDAGNPAHVGKAKKKWAERQLLVDDGFRQILASKNGRAWLFAHIEAMGPFQTIFSVPPDPLVMAYNAGKRDLGLALVGLLTRPEFIGSFVQMMSENNVK